MSISLRSIFYALILSGVAFLAFKKYQTAQIEIHVLFDNTYHNLAVSNFSQDWTNTGLITLNDNWSGVPSIIGYRGDNLTGSTGTDPQTLVAFQDTVDVNANQTNPNTFATGGVTEFNITNPTIALTGSGTADAPFIVLHLNSTNRQNIQVSYNLRDIDGSTDTATQRVALQYRIGTSGNFTNIPAGYVADASTGPSLATLVTPVSVTLPAACNNESQLQVRIITSNAAGNDEWIGIDDILVTSTAISSTPTLNINDVSLAEGDAGTTNFTFNVSLTAPAGLGGVTFDIATANNTALLSDNDYVLNSLTSQTIPADSSTYQFTVQVNGDVTVESNESFFVNVTNVTGATVGDTQGEGTIQNDDFASAFIHDIQGPGASTPIESQSVKICGIVTQVYPDLDGFFMQEEVADYDADPATSEGIFVFTGNNPTVNTGDKVQVIGAVDEFFAMTQIDNDNANLSVSVISTGNPLPTKIEINLPIVGDVNEFYEKYEGMLVGYNKPLVVSEYFEHYRYGQLELYADARPYQYTHIDESPSEAEYIAYLDSLSRNRVIIDDGNNIQNYPLANSPFKLFFPQPSGFGVGTQGTNFFRGGDTVKNLCGILHWSFAGQTGTDAWRIRPLSGAPATFTVGNPRPGTPQKTRGNISIASFNVLNYFKTLNVRGAHSVSEFNRQNQKLIPALDSLNADVFGLVELENNGTTIDTLVNRLNAAVGANTYKSIQTGVLGSDEITVGIIYKPSVVAPLGSFATLTAANFIDPNSESIDRNRPALAQTFKVIDPANPDFGAVFSVAVNHLKSKGGGGAMGFDTDQNDGAGAFNDTRQKAATVLASWIATDPTGSGDPDYINLGDLNSYKNEDPIKNLETAGFTDLLEHFEGNKAYSYVFDGMLGYLDYALANAPLLPQVVDVISYMINSDEGVEFDYNDTIQDIGESSFNDEPSGNILFEPNPFRTSDHDPVLICLDLVSICDLFTGTSIYVDSAATAGANNGSSWINAFTKLQDALTIARACGIDTVKVALGTYYPDEGIGFTDNARDSSFNIPNSLVLLGGYGGITAGADSNSRDWECNKTILSGDIDQIPDSINNSYHVVYTKNVDSTTLVDGFCINGGNADDGSFPNNSGGGWYNDGSGIGSRANPNIINVIISGNYAELGGGMFNNGITNGISSPILTNMIINGNIAKAGGGIYNYVELSGTCSPTLTNVIISSNRAIDNGGAMFNCGFGISSLPVLTNIVISGNIAQRGGGIYTSGGFGSPMFKRHLR